MTAKEWLEWLALRPAASGLERPVLDEIAQRVSAWTDESHLDAAGNLVLIRHGQGQGPLLLLAAHIDQICLWVKDILPGGFLQVVAPGIHPQVLPGARVQIGEFQGVVAMTPPHLRRTAPSATDSGSELVAVDLGETEETVRGAVRPGDPVFFAAVSSGMGEDRFTGAGLDNRASVAATLLALESLVGLSPWVDLAVVLTSSEEAGLIGASAAGVGLHPDLALAVDVTYGRGLDTPVDLTLPLGHGPAIGRGPNCHLGLERFLIRAARHARLPFQVEVMAGNSGTDAWALQVSGGGVRTGTVSVPLLYMHTPAEVVSLADIRCTASLLGEAVQLLDQDSYQEIVQW
ncbi:MAG: M42 family metallopeptidase [Sulfobacillus sp.]